MHTLFAGTFVTASAPAVSPTATARRARRAAAAAAAAAGGRLPGVPPTPDGGCVQRCRTGFSSSQGELMQMIEFSQAKVTTTRRDDALLLLLGRPAASATFKAA